MYIVAKQVLLPSDYKVFEEMEELDYEMRSRLSYSHINELLPYVVRIGFLGNKMEDLFHVKENGKALIEGITFSTEEEKELYLSGRLIINTNYKPLRIHVSRESNERDH